MDALQPSTPCNHLVSFSLFYPFQSFKKAWECIKFRMRTGGKGEVTTSGKCISSRSPICCTFNLLIFWISRSEYSIPNTILPPTQYYRFWSIHFMLTPLVYYYKLKAKGWSFKLVRFSMDFFLSHINLCNVYVLTVFKFRSHHNIFLLRAIT